MSKLEVHCWEIDCGDYVPDMILDIRSKDLFQRGYIKGSVNLPYVRFQAEAEASTQPNVKILVVDPAGARAAEMAVWLRARGRVVRYLKGGLALWRGPLETG